MHTIFLRPRIFFIRIFLHFSRTPSHLYLTSRHPRCLHHSICAEEASYSLACDFLSPNFKFDFSSKLSRILLPEPSLSFVMAHRLIFTTDTTCLYVQKWCPRVKLDLNRIDVSFPRILLLYPLLSL